MTTDASIQHQGDFQLRHYPAEQGSMLSAALAHAEAGRPVFPCDPDSKKPRTLHGFKDATTDPTTISMWWDRWPDAMIGMPTGLASGCFVVDIDQDPLTGKDGQGSLDALEASYGTLPDTVESMTPRGGRHLYFKHPGADLRVPNSAGKLGKDIDIRGDGGYIILPPSLRVDGRAYAWEDSSNPDEGACFAKPPPWLLAQIAGRKDATAPHSPAAPVTGSIPSGQRNTTLTSLAGSLRLRGMTEPDILAALNEENAARCAPPLSDDEVARIAASVARYAAGTAEATHPGGADDQQAGVPGDDERPCFRVFDNWKHYEGHKYRPGVWYFGTDREGSPTQTWVCSPLYVAAVTSDGQDNNFGRLLRFRNSHGRWREWAMPMERLSGLGNEVRAELLAMGAEIQSSNHARQLLADYLQRQPPKRTMRCALQTGWAGPSYVLPDGVIGPDAAGVIFQSGERWQDEYTQAGTPEGWKQEIAARAVGNPMLLISISAAFAGPLLKPCHAESGGLHLVGDSSTGKTTAIEAACSVWGGPNHRRSWRATANGMEGAAALFNDSLLALDEISECDPREVGAIVYALGNGRGKQRASRTGAARGVTRWRCLVLSSGERTLATHMMEAGHRAKAGQAVRMLDIPVARPHGAWDTLHDIANAAAFSDAIKRSAAKHHGHAGRAFLEKLTRDPRDFSARLEERKALPLFAIPGGEGQDKRAAARFALVGMAGELATEYGLTGWPEGAALAAAGEGLRLWRSLRGSGNDERRQILEAVSAFITRHGDSRFSPIPQSSRGNDPLIRDRAGWWRTVSLETRGPCLKGSPPATAREYLFTKDAMREALRGFDFRRALDTLEAAGALPQSGATGERAQPFRIGGRNIRLYPINADRLTGADDGG